MTEEPVVKEAPAAVEKEVKKKKPKNYVNNGDMMIQIQLSREAGRMTDELAKMMVALCNRYAKHPDYSRIYSYDEDMKAFGLLTVCKVWRSFNPEKSNNPFAYFTQILRHAFYQYLNQETKQRTIKDVVLIDIGEQPSFKYMENYSDDGFEESEVFNVTSGFGEGEMVGEVIEYSPEPLNGVPSFKGDSHITDDNELTDE